MWCREPSLLSRWNVVQSQQVLEWIAEGEARGRAAALIEILEMRFGPVPVDLQLAIREETDLAQLKQWVEPALVAYSLTDFRQLVQR
jgi:hypothetical protein